MKLTRLALEGVFLIEPTIFKDERGFFFESFNQRLFCEATSHSGMFVQDNHSRSMRHVLRGLHYQAAPMAQGKLVRVIQGEIWDVVVDIRRRSPTYGQHIHVILSEANRLQLWIPPGFAHGFLTLSESTEMLYKTTKFYSKAHERSIRWDDPSLGIDWPTTAPILLSEKDEMGAAFSDLDLEEEYDETIPS